MLFKCCAKKIPGLRGFLDPNTYKVEVGTSICIMGLALMALVGVKMTGFIFW